MTVSASEVAEVQTGLLADESGQGVPGVPVDTPPQSQIPPQNHSFLAWLSCLCFCWPIGAFAIYASHDVDYRWARGDFDGAREASRRAKGTSLAAIVIGIVYGFWYVFYFLQSTISQHSTGTRAHP
eukprot:g13489.t1